MPDNPQKPRVVFLTGKITNLRPVLKEEIPLVTKWINDPEVRQFLHVTFPRTEREEEEWYNKIGANDENLTLCIETKDGKPIGIMSIHNIDWVHRHGITGALIGEKEYWGKGYGTDAKMHLLDHAFNTMNLNRIGSNAFEWNERSIRYSLRCGYKIEGRKRQHLCRNGKFWDLVELGILREDWEPVWEKFKNS